MYVFGIPFITQFFKDWLKIHTFRKKIHSAEASKIIHFPIPVSIDSYINEKHLKSSKRLCFIPKFKTLLVILTY